MTTSKKWNYVFFSIGLTLVASGIVLGIVWPIICQQLLKEKLQLNTTSTSYKLWLETPIPMYLELYLFNWTNAHESVYNKSVIPNFEEFGPFVFFEVHDRVNITWNNNFTVTYNQTRTWHFVPDLSPYDLSTEITNINVLATTIAYTNRHPSAKTFAINLLFSTLKEKLIVTKPAREWLFDGMNDEFMDFINKLNGTIHLPIPYDKFGFFYERNLSSSYDGMYTINTGVNNIYDLGVMDRWNHVNATNYFSGECAMVNGTSGELFPPMQSFKSNLTAFISDVCSSVTLNYAAPASVEGLDGYEYVGDASMLDNGTSYPENKCFCNGECVPSGVRNVSSCRFGAPLFFSFPHFYLADPSYLNAVTGLKPNKTEHEFKITIHPATGIPLEVRAQLQINVLLQPVPAFSLFKKARRDFIPVLWFRQRAKITGNLAFQAAVLQILPPAGLGLFYGISGIGLIIILVKLIGIIKRSRKSPESEPLLNPATEEAS